MKIWEAPLPTGYDDESLYVRKWLLDLRLRVKSIPAERERMLKAAINEFCPDIGRKRSAGFGPGTRESNTHLLVKSVTG